MQNNRLLLAERIWYLREISNPLASGDFITARLFCRLLNVTLTSPYGLSIKSLREAHRLASVSAVRQMLRRLEQEGWIRMEGHPDDQRVRCVLPTKQFGAVAAKFMTDLDALLKDAAALPGQSESKGASVRGR